MTKKWPLLGVALVLALILSLLGFAGCQRAYISNIVLNETYLEMNVGDEAAITAVVDVGMSVEIIWTSSNSAVATVDKGVVTAVASGATSVKAAAHGKVAVCTVVVLPSVKEEDQEPEKPLDDRFEFLTFTEEDGFFRGRVLQDSVCTFNFHAEIATGADITYIVCRDIECTQIVNSKIVSLKNGINLFYVLTSCGNVSKLYYVLIEQIPTYSVILHSDGDRATVTCADTNLNYGSYVEGQSVTITVKDIALGYVFDGWYDGEFKVSGDKEYTFTMPPQTKVFTAKFSLDNRIENLDFESASETF